MIAGGAMLWSSKCQPTVALSTTEAEYMALTRSAQQALWMFNFLSKVDLPQHFPTIIRADNQLSINLAGSTKGHACVKHIDIQHHYI